MAHSLLKLSGAYGSDILAAGSYRTDIPGHAGPYQNLLSPICAAAYVSATVTLTNVLDASGKAVKNNFVENGTGILAADGQIVFTDDVYAFTCDQPVKVWYSK